MVLKRKWNVFREYVFTKEVIIEANATWSCGVGLKGLLPYVSYSVRSF